MIRKFNLYCPNIKRNVLIFISIPKNYENEKVEYDSLYVLDGQNAFKDNDAAFGRSLRLGKHLGVMAKKFNKRICGIGISNAGTDLGRINEYTPFKLETIADKTWEKQDTSVCQAFTKDLINTIIPHIQKHFPVKKNPERTYIFGSSLGGLYAAYAANTYPEVFGGAGLFSTASFLCEKAFYNHLHTHLNKNCRNFIYVGTEETSDGSFDKDLYLNTSLKLHYFLKENGCNSRLCIDTTGVHNEATWDKHMLEFLSYMYYNEITITK